MYSSQFDGNAAFSGGGFMPSQSTQTPDSSSAPSRVLLYFPLLIIIIAHTITLKPRNPNAN